MTDNNAPTRKKRSPSRKSSAEAAKRGMTAPDKMLLLFTVVSREKAEFFIDLLEGFEINMQMVLSASGTASTQMMELLGLTNSEKSVIISTLRKDRESAVLSALEEKFRTVRGGAGIAYTVPMSSIIGVAIYQFLSNKTGNT